MMPHRILREGILTSDAVDKLSPGAELFYRRLISVVDDFGRFDGRASVLRAACFPLRIDKVREADISRWITECETAGLLALYAVDDKPYLIIFKIDRPRAKTSKYPEPPEHLRANDFMRERVRPYSYSYSNAHIEDEPLDSFPPELQTEAFANAWREWTLHRAQIKKKLTPLAVKKQLKTLAALGPTNAIAAIERSISNGWTGIFPDERTNGEAARVAPLTKAREFNV